MTLDPLLAIETLNGWYDESHVLHGVDIVVPAGQTVAILGRNGVGKTSTLRGIVGLLTRVTGSVRMDGIERVRDEKLGRALGESAERARPRIMPFWQSGQTFPNMAGNIEAVRKLFVDAEFAEIVAGESPGVQDSVLFDLDRVARLLAEEQSPIAEAVTDPDQREKLEALRVGLHSARETASELIAQGAGLNFGFNAGDGD